MPIPTPSASYRQRQHVESMDRETTVQQQLHNENTLKRRSLLPQLGQATYTSRLPETTSTAKVNQDRLPGRPRPKSMYVTTLARTEQETAEDHSSNPKPMGPSTSTNKPLEGQTVGLSRSRSLRKPNIPIQSGQAKVNSTHSRTQSTSNLPTQRMVHPGTGNPARSNNAHATSTTTAPRTSARLAGLSRIGSVNKKPNAAQAAPSTRTATKPDASNTTQSRRREVTKDEPPLAARPAFTTLQQHFTPRKVGKAPTSTFLQPVATNDTKVLPPELTTLQSELLQLHLVHRGSLQVEHQWHINAKRSLRRKFDEVVSYHSTMLEQERAGQEHRNLQALSRWSKGEHSADMVQFLQLLSGPLHELPSLIGNDGRFHPLASDFEQWMMRAKNVWSARTESAEQPGDLNLVGDLGEFWQAETASMIRKLTAYVRDMDQLPAPAPGSSIACIVDACNALLKGTLEELHAMQLIVADVVAEEKKWVEKRLQAIAQDVVMDTVDKSEGIAAWEM